MSTTNPNDAQAAPGPRTGGLHTIGDKIKGTIEIVHGAGDHVRGSALSVFDSNEGGGLTKNQEISQKGKEEFQRGMAHWKGETYRPNGAGGIGQVPGQGAYQTGAGGHADVPGQAGTQGAAGPYGKQGAAAEYGNQGATAPYGTQGAPAPYGGQGTGTAYGPGPGGAGDVKAGGQQDASYPSGQYNGTSHPGDHRNDAPTGVPQGQPGGGQSQYASYPPRQHNDTSYPGDHQYDAAVGGSQGQPRGVQGPGLGNNYPVTTGQPTSGVREGNQ